MPRTARVEERVALLYVMGGGSEEGRMVRIHAAVPYISTLQHVAYPYNLLRVKKEFRDTIEEAIVTLRLEFEEGRHGGSRRIDDKAGLGVMELGSLEVGVARHVRILKQQSGKLIEEMHFERIIDFLFSLAGDVDVLQIFSNVPDIPWDWFYSDAAEKFLCEVFGIGITLPQGEDLGGVLFSRRDRSLSSKELRSPECVAFLVGNSYKKEVGCLADMEDAIKELAHVVEDTFSPEFTLKEMDLTARELGRDLGRSAEELRLLVLAGHFGEPGYRCSDTYFGPEELAFALEKAGGKVFKQHPVVILNGCRSEGRGNVHLGSQFSSQRSLAQAFLDRGAGACVFTSAKVRMKFARRFAKAFLRRLLEAGTSLGAALVEARGALDKDECYEWAVYHLLGDPSYVMVRGEEEEGTADVPLKTDVGR